MHDAPKTMMRRDELRDIAGRSAVVDRYREVELDRQAEQRVKPRHLRRPLDRAMLEVESHLTNRDHAIARGQRANLRDIRVGLLGRIVSEPGPDSRKRRRL